MGYIGLGAIARDSFGTVCGVTTIRMPGANSSFIVVCLAAREGPQLVAQCGFQNWVIESDASLFNRRLLETSNLMSLMILEILCHVMVVEHSAMCPVKGNTIAHYLTSYACLSSNNAFWCDSVPLFLGLLVKDDLLA
ncbi:hypothetical protein TIFTF001_025532 [Ficus carica]|uniref:RNase H type-1 domain-containing protein n=1 Tax=Ficus carica TaxID=3494 RepID=A0AA88DGP3_FICCA|nr:hypothetical protein TIFTF001_025532 [Ficus carica]